MWKKVLIGALVIALIVVGFLFLRGSDKISIFKGTETKKEPKEIEYVYLDEKDDPLMRGVSWEMTIEEVSEQEKNNYSQLYVEGKQFLTYEDVLNFEENYLLTYLFNDNQRLVGILYELETDELSRQELAEKHQEIAKELNITYEDFNNRHFEDFKWEDGKRRIYDHNLWNDDIVDGTLEMTSVWRGNNHTTFLNTTAQPYFDFLFTKKEDIDFGNQIILLVDNTVKDISQLYEIKPPLTQEMKEAKERAFDMFERSVHEDNLGKVLAKKNEKQLRILRFSKTEQYFVITNDTEEILDLSGWYIRTQNKGLTFYFDDDFEIKPGEHILIHGKDGRDKYKSGVSRILEWSDEEVFDTKQDRVTIYNHLDQEVDSAR